MKPKILVTRKMSNGAEEILRKEFDVTLNLEDKPFSVECDYLENCNYTCLWEPDGNEKPLF